MDAVDFLKQQSRMCQKHNNCNSCPAQDGCYTDDFEGLVNVVEKWAIENPTKTRLQDFLEKYPNATIDEDDGVPDVCCIALGYCKEHTYDGKGNIDCVKCWNKPLEE